MVLNLLKTLHHDYSSSCFHLTELNTKFFGLAYNIVMKMISNKKYYGEDDESSSKAWKEFIAIMNSFLVSGVLDSADFLPVLRWLGIGGYEKWL